MKKLKIRWYWFVRKFKVIYFLLLFIPFTSFSQQFWGKYESVVILNASDKDQPDNEFYWTISSGNSFKVFVITPCSGELKADSTFYSKFTYSKTFYLTCKATDQAGLSSTEKLKIVLWKIKGVKQIPKVSRVL